MSKLTTESQSNDLYKEAEQIKRDVERLSVEKFQIELELRRLGDRFASLDHTFGTLNPGQRIGWGVGA